MTATVAPTVIEMSITMFQAFSGDLIRQHYTEVTQDKRFALDPDWPAYEKLEAAGFVLCLGAFVDVELVGYSLNFIYPRHLHYDYSFAQNDIFFVSKPYRGPQFGRKETIGDLLRAETMNVARARGAKKLFWHAKEKTAMSRWLGGLGLAVQDIIYGEDL